MRLILPYDTILGRFVVVLTRSPSKRQHSKRVNATAVFLLQGGEMGQHWGNDIERF